jgi:2-keto-4-pentenoate hydratase/2-oxohepta-3-ene-1,7-dioic acid hydratase in catechol pathway
VELHREGSEQIMRIARVSVNGTPRWATIEGDRLFGLQDVYGAQQRGEALGQLAGATLLAPAEPKKIVCVGLNYAAHAAESGKTVPEAPLMFFKPPTALTNPGDDIAWPVGGTRIDGEAELAIVMRRRAKLIPADRWRDYVLGFTCGNDVSERDWQDADGQWSRAKGFDTSCPLGPWLETEINPDHRQIRGWLDGKLQQDSDTSDLFHKAGKLVWFVSQYFTMEPGDVIMTGTPAHPGRLQDGSEYTVEIEGIGKLTNAIRKPARS